MTIICSSVYVNTAQILFCAIWLVHVEESFSHWTVRFILVHIKLTSSVSELVKIHHQINAFIWLSHLILPWLSDKTYFQQIMREQRGMISTALLSRPQKRVIFPDSCWGRLDIIASRSKKTYYSSRFCVTKQIAVSATEILLGFCLQSFTAEITILVVQ